MVILMAIDNPDVVDAIGLEQVSGIVALTISDHLEWDEAGEHLRMLQAKIDQYLGFIETGELLDSYPTCVGKPVRIDVLCKYQPSDAVSKYLEDARRVVEEYGVSFAWSVPVATNT